VLDFHLTATICAGTSRCLPSFKRNKGESDNDGKEKDSVVLTATPSFLLEDSMRRGMPLESQAMRLQNPQAQAAKLC
jgi:hypothetical protein